VGAVAKILIVDDDSAVQATIKLLLEPAGHSVVVASDSKPAALLEAVGNGLEAAKRHGACRS
jgi:CheY-like chemotaxis protein